MMSDEKPDQVISEVVALKHKMYAVMAQGHYDTPWAGDIMNTSKTAKGVPKTAKKKISFEDYSNILKTLQMLTYILRSYHAVFYKGLLCEDLHQTSLHQTSLLVECEKCKGFFDERYLDIHFMVCDRARYGM